MFKQINGDLNIYRDVQTIAKQVLHEIEKEIVVGVSEKFLVDKCIKMLLDAGVTSTWYHNVPALVYVGERTRLSMSGRDYTPANCQAVRNMVVTIALSPSKENYWGAYAKSFIVEPCDLNQTENANEDYLSCISFVESLHEELSAIVKPTMSFGQIYHYFNDKVLNSDYRNLDYNKNFGHSIVKNLSDRRYIQDDSKVTVGEVGMFAFDTHIGLYNADWGVKLEHVYYLDNHKLCVL